MTTRKRPSAPHDEITVSKRLRLQHETARREPYTFDSCFSDELVVAIFSYLDYVELCTAQLVNGHWARLATDDQLWKRLFLQDYPSQRLRGSRGFSTRWSAEGGATGREIRPLPARLRVSGQVLWQPWKWMYRIGRNWQQGRCALESLADSGSSDRENTVSPEGYQHNDAPLVLLGGDLTFVASRHLSSSPRVTVHPPSDSPHHLMPSTSSRRDALTCITLDHSIPLEITPELAHTSLDVDFRLVAFLSSGSFSVFSIPPTAPRSYRETHRYTPISNQLDRTSSSELSVQHAAYSHPFLITLSASYTLSTWHISSSTSPLRLQTFQSFTSFPPSSLSLSHTASSYKLVVTYTTPVYPKHWGVAATEVNFTGQNADVRINDIRTDRAMSSITGWVDEEVRKEVVAEWSRKLSEVTAVDTDGKFVVIASNDNTLMLYRLYYKPSFRISFVRYLMGHSDGISATHVADGRCITEGKRGGLWVWDLESGRCVVVANPMEDNTGALKFERRRDKTALAFDDRKVVTCSDARLVKVWRFDV